MPTSERDLDIETEREVRRYVTQLLDIEEGLCCLPQAVRAFPEIRDLVDQALAATRARLEGETATDAIRSTRRPVVRD
jgi:hypothetical protein